MRSIRPAISKDRAPGGGRRKCRFGRWRESEHFLIACPYGSWYRVRYASLGPALKSFSPEDFPMAFKIKDLMISVLAAKGAGQKEICDDSCPELSCDIGTTVADTTHCSWHASTLNPACTVCSRNSCEASARLPQSTRLRASDLPKPKAQLRRALKQVEARGQTLAKKGQPQSG